MAEIDSSMEGREMGTSPDLGAIVRSCVPWPSVFCSAPSDAGRLPLPRATSCNDQSRRPPPRAPVAAPSLSPGWISRCSRSRCASSHLA
ncbi:hypothetical protein PR202_ga30962 [Eleusine coracana subsp. coracana]|uniref:Uncharacterized protein n=1 Tax=Eleusine coracana subsp. coracana TaxID=191504 RepID=A0AAV5DR78_ELECO|nr:hypothetical protein PR202_ga30962 [Eleusine coracana subsp. coracana]